MDNANEKMYTWLQLPFKIVGLNVLDPAWKFSPMTLFTICLFTLQQYCSLEFFITHLHSLDVLTECIAVSSTGLEIIVRMMMLLYHRENMIDTIGTIQNLSVTFRKCKGYKELNVEFHKVATFTIFGFGSIYMSTIMFALIPIFFPNPKKHNLPLALYLPVMPSDVAPYWHLNYAFHVTLNFMAIIFSMAIDCVMAVSIVAAVYQIRGLKQCLLELDTSAKGEALHSQLGLIVQTHVAVRKFYHELEGMYAGDLLVIFSAVCVILCMGMNVIMTDMWSPIWFFLIAALFQLFLLSLFGNRLVIESDSLADCVYSIDWVSLPVPEQRLVLIMIANAQPTLELNGIFMPLSMASFLSIVKASYSYYTILH